MRAYVAYSTLVVCILNATYARAGGTEVPATDIDREIEAERQRFDKEWGSAGADAPPYDIQNVLSLLKLDHPGLEATRAASERGDWPEAEKELLRYFKTTRNQDAPTVKKLSEPDRTLAEAALRHRFPGNKAFPPTFRGVRIDWRSEAVIDGKTIKDAEWLFQYHRLNWWPALAKAYAATGDERYAREWRYELVAYARENLPFARETPWFIARGMETYGRCLQHAFTLPYMLKSEAFDARCLRYFLASFYLQSEHIRTVYAKEGNHLLGELAAVFTNGISFPEFKKSGEWTAEALTRIPERMFADVYSDGMNKELVFSYHGMYVGLFSEFLDLAKKHGYADKLPREYHERLFKMQDMAVNQVFPDWTNCQFGDGWKGKPGDAAWLFSAHALKRYPDTPYFEFMATRGARGTPPPHKSRAFPESGFYFFRSGWDPNAVFMPLKCGAEAEWHNQIDNGTFDLYAFGRNFMVDSGCYLYGSTDAEEMKWREWFRSTPAHQTLTLDNRNIARKPRQLLWHAADDLVVLVVDNESYPDLTHRRTVLFVDNSYFIIHDQAIGTAAGTVRIHFQLVPCDHSFDVQKHEIRTTFAEGSNLIVQGFPQYPRLRMEKETGWVSCEYRKKESRPAWSFGVDKSKEQREVAFLTALVPYKEAPPQKITAQVRPDGNAYVYVCGVGERTRTIRVDPVEKKVVLRE